MCPLRCHHLNLPTSTSSQGPRVQIDEPIGAFVIQTTTTSSISCACFMTQQVSLRLLTGIWALLMATLLKKVSFPPPATINCLHMLREGWSLLRPSHFSTDLNTKFKVYFLFQLAASIFNFCIYYVYICLCVCTPMWRSEDKLWEWVLSFCHSCSRAAGSSWWEVKAVVGGNLPLPPTPSQSHLTSLSGHLRFCFMRQKGTI